MKISLPSALSLASIVICSQLLAQQPGATPRPVPAGQPAAQPAPGAPAAQPTAPPPLTTPKQKASYGVGLMLGTDLAQQRMAISDLDFVSMVRGMADAMNGSKPAVARDEWELHLNQLMQQIGDREFAKVKATPEWKALADKNKKAGDEFLAANKAKEGVKTLPSGVQYRVLKAGTGATPGLSDSVVANYKGTLTDGTVFDSSAAHGGPATFPVTGVIKGWTEALQKMKVGDKWQLVIPSELAYGERGSGESIGPNAVLVFEIDLVDVQKAGQMEAIPLKSK